MSRPSPRFAGPLAARSTCGIQQRAALCSSSTAHEQARTGDRTHAHTHTRNYILQSMMRPRNVLPCSTHSCPPLVADWVFGERDGTDEVHRAVVPPLIGWLFDGEKCWLPPTRTHTHHSER